MDEIIIIIMEQKLTKHKNRGTKCILSRKKKEKNVQIINKKKKLM